MLTVRIAFFALFLLLFSQSDCRIEVKTDTTAEDLALYLGTLKKIVEECSVHTRFTEPNYYFGLFLAKVNLQRALKDSSEKLDIIAVDYVKAIIEEIDDLLKFIQVTEALNMSTIERSIFMLIQNESAWIQGMRPLQAMHVHQMQQHGLPNWNTYKNLVSDYENGVPSPEQSDICLVSLAESSSEYVPGYNSMFSKCLIEKRCHEILINGSNYGYFLTHRQLLLLLANFGRGCSITTPAEDRSIIGLLCSTARNEAQYNMRHGFQSADLVLEQTSLCGLYGFPIITHRDWLNNFLAQQTSSGCFDSQSDTRLKTQGPKHQRRWFKNDKQNGDLHLTSVTASTLGTMVRFILSIY